MHKALVRWLAGVGIIASLAMGVPVMAAPPYVVGDVLVNKATGDVLMVEWVSGSEVGTVDLLDSTEHTWFNNQLTQSGYKLEKLWPGLR